MSRDDARCIQIHEIFRDCHRECGAFFGIGGGTEFIEQHKRMRRRRFRNVINIADVRRESREVLLDRLVITDVRKDGIKDCQLCRFSGNGNPRLRHQHQQAYGFQCNGLSSSIRAANNELPIMGLKRDGDRNHLRAVRFEISFEDRMTRVEKSNMDPTALGRMFRRER